MSIRQNNIIDIKNLKVYFKIRQSFYKEVIKREKKIVKAVDKINLSIKKGEILSLVGESGSGKTTTGKAVLQLVKKIDGSILFDNKEINYKDKTYMKKFRKRTMMIFQDPYQSLDPKFNALDTVLEQLQLMKIKMTLEEKEKKVITALEFAGLKPGGDFLYKYPHELSGGQRQRISIATSFIISPDFIVADEPVSMLDASVRADILKLFVTMKEEKGTSFMFITHDLALAWLISDRIAIMYLGKIVEIGSADLITGGYIHPYSQALASVLGVVGRKREKKMIILKGEIPSPINIPSGCRFHSRCPICEEKCKIEEPELVEYKSGHFVACHFPKRLL